MNDKKNVKWEYALALPADYPSSVEINILIQKSIKKNWETKSIEKDCMKHLKIPVSSTGVGCRQIEYLKLAKYFYKFL